MRLSLNVDIKSFFVCLHMLSNYIFIYREQLHGVRQKATEEEDSHDKLLKDLKQQLRDCDNDRLAAWDACKQQVSAGVILWCWLFIDCTHLRYFFYAEYFDWFTILF